MPISPPGVEQEVPVAGSCLRLKVRIAYGRYFATRDVDLGGSRRIRSRAAASRNIKHPPAIYCTNNRPLIIVSFLVYIRPIFGSPSESFILQFRVFGICFCAARAARAVPLGFFRNITVRACILYFRKCAPKQMGNLKLDYGALLHRSLTSPAISRAAKGADRPHPSF